MSQVSGNELLIQVHALPTVHLLDINRTPRLYVMYKMAEFAMLQQEKHLL